MSIIDTLVTDRTTTDVSAGNDKGTYNAGDLNRVSAAMIYVADRLRTAGYDPHISPKTDWAVTDWPTQQSMTRYLADLAELRGQFAQAKTTPHVPSNMSGLMWQEANDIERILQDIDTVLSAMLRVRMRSAQVLCFAGFAVYPREQILRLLLTADGKVVITSDGMPVYIG